MREQKDLRLSLKDVSENGTFEGSLTVYGVVDLGNDVVVKGALSKTITDQKGVVPMLWHHDPKTPLGFLHLNDTDASLEVKGEFFLEESEKAREIYAVSKRLHQLGKAMGLSIGYDALQKTIEKGVRYLKEIKLYEGSLTLFPMLPVAQITDIKSLDQEMKADYLAELQKLQVVSMREQMLRALCYSLDSIVYGYDSQAQATAAEKVLASEESIDQFKLSYLEHIPVLLEMWGVKADAVHDAKVGRRISATTRTYIEEAIQRLSALLTDDEGTSTEAAPVKSEAATDTAEPESIHSLLEGFSLFGEL